VEPHFIDILSHFQSVAPVPISGLVITFKAPVEEQLAAIASLRATPEIELGAARGSKLAIVVDSEDKIRDQEIWEMVRALPGVTDLAVALVAFDDQQQETNETFVNRSFRRNQT
jgi:nitrate reductase NapAB chaperone NapD